jgi:predicted DNA-binding transcriptional regulator AlpA
MTKLELVGAAEAAELLGITRAALWDRRQRGPDDGVYNTRWPEFPRPVAELRCGPVWLRSQIEEYLGVGPLTWWERRQRR